MTNAASAIPDRMPVFLYNYSDKTLQGIFRAVGFGDLDINPFGEGGVN